MTPGDVFGSPQYRFQKTPAAIKRPAVSFTPGSFPSLLSRDLVTFSHNSLQFAGRDRHL